jgi:hypothetical protein
MTQSGNCISRANGVSFSNVKSPARAAQTKHTHKQSASKKNRKTENENVFTRRLLDDDLLQESSKKDYLDGLLKVTFFRSLINATSTSIRKINHFQNETFFFSCVSHPPQSDSQAHQQLLQGRNVIETNRETKNAMRR